VPGRTRTLGGATEWAALPGVAGVSHQIAGRMPGMVGGRSAGHVGGDQGSLDVVVVVRRRESGINRVRGDRLVQSRNLTPGLPSGAFIDGGDGGWQLEKKCTGV
jgi:hypothetical protein